MADQLAEQRTSTNTEHNERSLGRQSRHSDLSGLKHMAPEPILLEDHSLQPNKNLWARDVGVIAYEVLEEAYVTWTIKIATIRGGDVTVYRRYSEFWDLHEILIHKFPLRHCEIPELPPKAMVARFEPHFLEQRRRGLDYFMKCIVLNETIGRSTVVREFCSDKVFIHQ